jgi:hypothetical protein
VGRPVSFHELSGTYTLAFTVSGTSTLTFLDKIGESVEPFNTDYTNQHTLSATRTGYAEPTGAISDASAGIVFVVYGSTEVANICVGFVGLFPPIEGAPALRAFAPQRPDLEPPARA